MSTQTAKLPYNEPCKCGSKKKYKHCCGKGKKELVYAEKYKTGAEKSSDKMTECVARFAAAFPEHKIIDVSGDLRESNYREFQMANMTDKTILFAEKTAENAAVFAGRVNTEEADMMMMWHGSYRTFVGERLSYFFKSLCNVVST